MFCSWKFISVLFPVGHECIVFPKVCSDLTWSHVIHTTFTTTFLKQPMLAARIFSSSETQMINHIDMSLLISWCFLSCLCIGLVISTTIQKTLSSMFSLLQKDLHLFISFPQFLETQFVYRTDKTSLEYVNLMTFTAWKYYRLNSQPRLKRHANSFIVFADDGLERYLLIILPS